MFAPLQFNKGNLARLIVNVTGVVNSWSAGTTGLTPAAASSGTVVLGGVLNVANGGTGVTTSTGTGSVVLNTSAQLVTPNIGVATGTSLVTTGNQETGTYAIIGRGLSPTAGGSTAYAANFFNATAIGVYTGTGSPTISASRGSLYLRNEGLPYYNTNGATGWAPVINATVPTTQNLTSGSGATYTPTSGAVVWIKVRMIGAGGGGGAVGGTTAPTGQTGGTTTFNGITAIGGTGGAGSVGAGSGIGGAGGTGGTGTAAMRKPGNAGLPGVSSGNGATTNQGPGPGAGGQFGGAPIVTLAAAGTGPSAAANTGAGGTGGTGTAGISFAGGGGGSGEYVELFLPASTYTYTITAGGSGGIGTGTAAATGGAGGSGFIFVEEYYNY